MRQWVLIVGFLGTVLSACGEPVGPELKFRNWPIINGTADTSAEHQAVVALWSDAGYLCSATMITRRVLLTAAHCAQDAPSTYTVIFGNTINSSTRRYVSEKWVHPQYNETYIRNDIALMRLSSDAPSSVTPIPHLPYSLRITQTDITNRTLLDFVGFGMTDPYNQNSSGTKMKFTDYLNYICTSAYGCSWPNPATSKNICQDQTPSGLCQGDSGGPAIVNRSGQLYVAGIASFTGQNCGDFGCNTKVDEYEADINNFLGGVLGAACTNGSQCDSGNCVDGVCCESTCPGACKACNVSGNLGHCVVVPDGTDCGDGNVCNGRETCQNGVCTQGTPPDCTSQNPCTSGSCDPANGCLYTPVANGSLCADANACNGMETCLNGVCQAGQPLDCDDQNACTQDSCSSAAGGCLHEKMPDGTVCGNDQCGPRACSGGFCLPISPPNCDDFDPCTEDHCDGTLGCVHQSLPDGYVCGECLMCQGGQCVEAPNCETKGGCGCAAGGGEGMAGGIGWMLFFLGARRRSLGR